MRNVLFISIVILLFVTGCSNQSVEKVDEAVLKWISKGLEERWEYTNELTDELTRQEFRKATEIELKRLKDYDIEDFKDPMLFSYYDSYKRNLETMLSSTENILEFKENWQELMVERATYLHKINSTYELNISDENIDTFKRVLSDADESIEEEGIKNNLNDIAGLSKVSVVIEGDSIAASYVVESVLSADLFVNSKTGFPDQAIKILEVLDDYDYDNIVISAIHGESIASSILFKENSLDRLDIDKWDEIEAHKIYDFSNAYQIRLGIWNELNEETQERIGEMNKPSENSFWSEHGFTHD